MNNTIVTITGPSCSGKSTLMSKLVETGKFQEIVSTTTRLPRAGEVNGKHYHFVTREEFDEINLMERIEYNGNAYGASVAEFEEKFARGATPAIVVDPHGMLLINRKAEELGWKVINIYVDCPLELRMERLLYRFAEDYRKILGVGEFGDYCELIAEYSGRLATIMRVEHNWLTQFNSHKNIDGATVIIPMFDRDTEKEILDTLVSLV